MNTYVESTRTKDHAPSANEALITNSTSSSILLLSQSGNNISFNEDHGRTDEMNDAKRFFMHNLSSRYFAVESFTNFVLVKTPDAKSLLNKMKENKILIRDRSSFQNLENCVRITIGSKKQIIKVLDVMNK